MHTYSMCGLTLASNILLPELNPSVDFGVGCKFWLMAPGHPSPTKIDWFHKWYVEGDDGEDSEEPWVCFARRDDGYLLRFPSYGDFFVSLDATEIRCCPLPGIPEVTVRHLLLDQVIPLVLSRHERIVLHASAVSTERGVIAFAGKSGQGKSTIALALAQNGCSLISDDCLVLRGGEGSWTALPSYPGVRLWQSTAEKLVRDGAGTADVAHYTSKRRVVDMDGLPFLTRPKPMRALFVLADDRPTISFERLEASRAFMAWTEFAYNLDIADTNFLCRHFETVGQLAAEVPAYALYYPREFNSLPAVREAIMKHLEETDNDPE